MKTISTSITIDATPDEVWETLVDFASHEQWNPFFARIEGSGDPAGPVVGETIKITARKGDGDGMSFSPTILEVAPGKMLRWKGKLIVPGIFDGEHIFELVELGDGRTQLNHGENFGGILIPFMSKVLSETKDGFEAFNAALATEVATRRTARCTS